MRPPLDPAQLAFSWLQWPENCGLISPNSTSILGFSAQRFEAIGGVYQHRRRTAAPGDRLFLNRVRTHTSLQPVIDDSMIPDRSGQRGGAIRRLLFSQIASVSLLTLAATAHGQQPSAPVSLSPADYLDEARLTGLLWEQSPEVVAARRSAGIAASEVTRARQYPNPALDFTWGTIPIGPSNPPDLHDPLGNVPNYNVGISELFEIAKRGPRQAATKAEFEAARAQAMTTLATRFFDLMDTIGRIARSQVRAAVINGQVNASKRMLELDRARASKGDIAGVDVQRSEVEHARLVAAREAARTDLEAARAACAAITAADCPPFQTGNAARRFLRETAVQNVPTTWSAEFERRRPDIAALNATLEAAGDRATLAKRRVIPDVTVRMGYTYDTFVAAGNQRQSLALGMQLPLPVMDQGQADLQAAMVTIARASRIRDSLVESGRQTLNAATRQRELVAARIRQLDAALSKARQLRDSTLGAARQGGASQVDVLLAVRAYQELLLDRTDLDADAYEAALAARQAVAAFPQPTTTTNGRQLQ
jgi:cobalt-zinc-cadmium efflux system outer membrane protein